MHYIGEPLCAERTGDPKNSFLIYYIMNESLLSSYLIIYGFSTKREHIQGLRKGKLVAGNM